MQRVDNSRWLASRRKGRRRERRIVHNVVTLPESRQHNPVGEESPSRAFCRPDAQRHTVVRRQTAGDLARVAFPPSCPAQSRRPIVEQDTHTVRDGCLALRRIEKSGVPTTWTYPYSMQRTSVSSRPAGSERSEEHTSELQSRL